MAALKELKARIASVQSTLKITSAMKMVASAKLHRVQSSMETLSEYERRFSGIAGALCCNPDIMSTSELTLTHKEHRHASVVAFSSDTSLCGAFNANVTKMLSHTLESLRKEGFGKVTVYPIGEKIAMGAAKEVAALGGEKAGWSVCSDYKFLAGKASFSGIVPLADLLMKEYLTGRTDRVCTVYNHFQSMGHQVPVYEPVLPFNGESIATSEKEVGRDYILEPDAEYLLRLMLPSAVRTRFWRTLLDSITAENAARMIAMQTATDNAQDLLDELSLEYNKRRQQAITEELADIVQGA